jgi:hypothetical protein
MLDDLLQPWIRTQETISKRQGVPAGIWTLLEAFGKLLDPDLSNTTVLNST